MRRLVRRAVVGVSAAGVLTAPTAASAMCTPVCPLPPGVCVSVTIYVQDPPPGARVCVPLPPTDPCP